MERIEEIKFLLREGLLPEDLMDVRKFNPRYSTEEVFEAVLQLNEVVVV
jgi:hypothetical protein